MNKYDKDISDLKRKATKNQEEASNPSRSVWVEASAGTGKTKVLSDRVLRLLLNGVAPSKILCLTYTNAAASEMKTRVADRLSKWTVMSEKELTEEINTLYYEQDILTQKPELITTARKLFAKVLDASDQMKIETIHAFCTEILKRFPLEAGISPYFDVADEQTTKEMLNHVSQKLLAVIEENSDETIKEATLYLTSHIKELKWSEFLKDIIDARQSFYEIFKKAGSQENFQSNLRQQLNLEHDPSSEVFLQNFWRQTDFETLKKYAVYLIEDGGTNDKKRGTRLLQDLEKRDFDDYFACLSRTVDDDYEPRPQLVCQDADKKHPEIKPALENEALRTIKAYKKLQNIDVFEATLAVSKVALRLIEDYAAYKRERSCMDFNDLIVTTRDLLTTKNISAWVLYKLDYGIDHILIDEAQDTSPTAWQIISKLTSEFFDSAEQKGRTLFVVGDKKQSIYSFQGADQETFDEMREKYKKITSPITLQVSFRSTSAVLKTVNKLFSIDAAKQGVTSATDKVNHDPFRLGEGGLVEIWPITEENEKPQKVWQEPIYMADNISKVTKIAFLVAQHIKDMVSNKEILASKGRPVKYSDFMVLLRKRGNFMEEFVKAAKKLGISVTGIDRLNLKKEIAVEDLCALSNFLLLEQDDLSLASVLRSPLYGLSEEDLFELCFNRGNKTLWERLKESPKFNSQKEELSTLLGKAQVLRPFELFDMVLNTFEGKKRFYQRLGEEAKDAIDEFMNLCLKFESSHIPNLQNFMAWFNENDVEVKRELEQATTDAVRLMTVHQSKGLQAPIVILPDTTHYVDTDREQQLLFDFDDSVFYFPLSSDRYNQKCIDLYQKKIESEINEEHRLLYVAATRAEDRLYIAGVKMQKKGQTSWYDLCKEALEQLTGAKGNDKIKYEVFQEVKPEDKQKDASQPIATDHHVSWLNKPLPKEENMLKTFTPSHVQDIADDAVSSPLAANAQNFRRGILIHKLLQMLPRFSSLEQMAHIIKAYLSRQADLNDKLKADVEEEVLNVLSNEDFSFIFKGDSRAEVPVMGSLEGNIVSGQIDRLVVLKDKVLIVDFKTNRPAAKSAADVSQNYKMQLDIYAELIKQIYPNKQIEKYILWTNTLKLMKI